MKLDLLNQQLEYFSTNSQKIEVDNLGKNQELENEITNKIENELSTFSESLISNIEQKFENQFLQYESLLQLYNSLPNLKFLPPTRGWAGSPDFLAKIAEVISIEKPRFIMEASSGVSTLVIGLALKMNNFGKSISFDHDSTYARKTTQNIKINEIIDFSIVKHCPLINYNEVEQSWKWYDTHNLEFKDKIDILIIDGPPRTTQFLARYPAVPLLYKHFADRTLILLDDANRNDEVIIIQKWIDFLENNNFEVVVSNFNNFEKGLVILEVCKCGKPHNT